MPRGGNHNPTGKGGFKDHPENSIRGLWDSRHSFKYWMQKFKTMTVGEFRDYEDNHPEDKRTVAESLAYARVHNARSDAADFDRVANRTEGMPTQPVDWHDDKEIRTEEQLNDIIAKEFERYDARRQKATSKRNSRKKPTKGK
jgi:hypothetical protein